MRGKEKGGRVYRKRVKDQNEKRKEIEREKEDGLSSILQYKEKYVDVEKNMEMMIHK